MSSATSPRARLDVGFLALTIAQDWLGLEEDGDNSGPGVHYLQEEAGIGDGAPWCAAAVNTWARQAHALKDLESPLERVPKQGLVQSYVDYGVGHGWVVRDDGLVLPGDIFCLQFPGGEYHHMGLVREPIRDSHFITVEGNSNDDGSREGRAVVSNPRRVTGGVLFLSPWED